MLYETGYTIGLAASLTCLLFPRGTLLICSSFNVSGMVLPQGFSLGTGCSLSLDGSSPGISQLTPSPPSSLCPEVILSDSPHIHPALNHNPSFHSPSHTQKILLCFIRSISFITTYCTQCLLSVFFSYQIVSSFKTDFFSFWSILFTVKNPLPPNTQKIPSAMQVFNK